MLEQEHTGVPAAGKSPAPKRRKVRKGTQSCWECKRRKTRCTFSAPTETVCDGCRSRHTSCLSQEFPDETGRARRAADRLRDVETLVEQLIKRREGETQTQSDAPLEKRELEPQEVDTQTAESLTSQLHLSRGDDLYEVSGALREAWPTQHDLNLILSVQDDASMLFHGVVCLPYARFTATQLATPRQLLQTPPPGTHPVSIARKLLMLGSLLQGLPPDSVDKLGDTESDYLALMSRAVDAAHRLVTSNDELACSVEGIECVMMESMYLNNAGNLRRAWLTNRRAMHLAQLAGLHSGSGAYLEQEPRHRIDPEYMWFRIVLSDRYLSLMLGLPQGSPENIFSRPIALAGCPPLERMERLVSVATGLTLQRNGTERTDYTLTSQIDRMLREAAALMPPQWWLMAPDPAAATSGAPAFEESIRLTNQLAHRHLLVQLHLPYMLQPASKERNYDYSKMTAATASRALLAQFVAVRQSAWATAYCRGIDFVAFVASTTLCLAHIEARHQHTGVFESLQHERLSDRGLLERTLEILQDMAHSGGVIARKISSILRPLLEIENSSDQGSVYRAKKLESGAAGPDAANMLKIEIPYFGTITIEKYQDQTAAQNSFLIREPTKHQVKPGGTAGYEFSAMPPANSDWQAVPSIDPSVLLQHSTSHLDTHAQTHLLVPGLSADVEDWALQGVDMALFSSLTHGLGP